MRRQGLDEKGRRLDVQFLFVFIVGEDARSGVENLQHGKYREEGQDGRGDKNISGLGERPVAEEPDVPVMRLYVGIYGRYCVVAP